MSKCLPLEHARAFSVSTNQKRRSCLSFTSPALAASSAPPHPGPPPQRGEGIATPFPLEACPEPVEGERAGVRGKRQTETLSILFLTSLTSYNASVPHEYSTYEAKARFSELLRQVRQGKTVTVTYRGEPVAEIRPIQRGPETVEERLAEYERRGILARPSERRQRLKAVERRAGALRRFLVERNV